MGYYTNYSVEISNVNGLDEAYEVQKELFELALFGHKCDGTNILAEFDSKWYDCEKDCKKVSKMFPHILIEIEGRGEDAHDHWKARFQKGASEFVQATVTFEPFKEIMK